RDPQDVGRRRAGRDCLGGAHADRGSPAGTGEGGLRSRRRRPRRQEARAGEARPMSKSVVRPIVIVVVAAALLLLVVSAWRNMQQSDTPPGLVSSNGRIEATEINAAAKFAGRVQEILVGEGDFVKAGDPLVRMQVDSLEAQRNEAVAMKQQAVTAVASSKAQVAARESDLQAAKAAIVQA